MITHTLTPANTVERLRRVEILLSAPLNGPTLERQPQVVQVWFEPSPSQQPPGASPFPSPLMALHGETKLAPREIVWSATDARERLATELSTTGRMMLRVHCGHLIDEKERSFSSSVDALVGVRSMHLQAGVFEGWFFVVLDRVPAPGRPLGRVPAKKATVKIPARKRGSRTA